MRDDERYPTVADPAPPEVAYSDAPEVVPPGHMSPANLSPHDKYFLPEKPEGKKEDVPAVHNDSPPRTIWGLKRKTFFIALAVVIILVIVAIVGGVAGGITSKKNAQKDNSNNSNSNSNSNSTTPSSSADDDTNADPPNQSGPIKATQRAVTASVSGDEKSSDVQVFYQEINTTDIKYRRVIDDKAKALNKVDLQIEPAWGTPLAAAARNGSDPLTTQIFYLGQKDNKNTSDIVEATLECKGTQETCATVSNTVISSNFTEQIHQGTKLSALRIDDLIRVYYQHVDKSIHALDGDDPSTGWQDHAIISNGAFPSTYFSVVAAGKDSIHLFYVGNNTHRLRLTVYDDSLGAKQDGDKEVDPTPGSDWRVSNTVTAVYVPFNAPYRCYYAQPNNGSLYSYWYSAETSAWIGIHNESWGEPTGIFASTGWHNQVRLYYFRDDGELVVNSQDNITWSEPSVL